MSPSYSLPAVFPVAYDDSAMLAHLVSLLALHALAAVAAVTWTATPFNPHSVPLAVRSPYLSAWLNQGAGTALNGDWPKFWTGSVSEYFITRSDS